MNLRPLSELVSPVKTWNPALRPAEVMFRYIDLSAVDQSTKSIVGARTVLCSEAPSRARQLVMAGDVVVSTVRPNLNGVAKVIGELDGATASTGFCVLRPRPELLDSDYLFNWVKSPQFVAEMVKRATGASYPAVSDRIILASTIPLPVLSEQRRIASVLDEAAALGNARLKSLAELDGLAETIFTDMFGDLESNPKGLPISRLEDLCLRVTDGTHQSPTWEPDGIPFLFISNIVDGRVTYDTNKFISRETYAELTRRCPIEPGDILFTTVGSYGNVAVVSGAREFCFQRHIAHIKPNPVMLDSMFCSAALRSAAVRRQVDKVARGVAQKTVNLSDLKRLRVFSPPVKMQQTFGAKLEAVESLKNAGVLAVREHERLLDGLQYRAFRGEL